MAIPLQTFLTTGSYEGFDIIPDLVQWCRREITPHDPRFHFQLANIFNKTYNPRGRSRAREFRFPYSDGTFDFTFLTSVFTHMLPPDVEHYTAEIVRTLKPNGRVLMTFFLLNEESLRLKDTKASHISLKKSYLDGQVLVMKRWKPEAVVGYPEATVHAEAAALLLRLEDSRAHLVWILVRPAGIGVISGYCHHENARESMIYHPATSVTASSLTPNLHNFRHLNTFKCRRWPMRWKRTNANVTRIPPIKQTPPPVEADSVCPSCPSAWVPRNFP